MQELRLQGSLDFYTHSKYVHDQNSSPKISSISPNFEPWSHPEVNFCEVLNERYKNALKILLSAWKADFFK